MKKMIIEEMRRTILIVASADTVTEAFEFLPAVGNSHTCAGSTQHGKIIQAVSESNAFRRIKTEHSGKRPERISFCGRRRIEFKKPGF